MFLGVLNKNNCHSLVIELRSSRSSHHLEDVCYRVVDIVLGFAIKVLGSLDDDEVGRKVHAPCQGACCD